MKELVCISCVGYSSLKWYYKYKSNRYLGKNYKKTIFFEVERVDLYDLKVVR